MGKKKHNISSRLVIGILFFVMGVSTLLAAAIFWSLTHNEFTSNIIFSTGFVSLCVGVFGVFYNFGKPRPIIK